MSFKEIPIVNEWIQKDVIEIHFCRESFVLDKNSSNTDILR